MTVKFLIMKEGRRTVEEAKAFARYREIDKDIKRDALKVFEAI